MLFASLTDFWKRRKDLNLETLSYLEFCILDKGTPWRWRLWWLCTAATGSASTSRPSPASSGIRRRTLLLKTCLILSSQLLRFLQKSSLQLNSLLPFIFLQDACIFRAILLLLTRYTSYVRSSKAATTDRRPAVYLAASYVSSLSPRVSEYSALQ